MKKIQNKKGYIKKSGKTIEEKVDEAIMKMTGDGYTAKEKLLITTNVALRGLSDLLTEEEVAKILKDSFPVNYLGKILRILLIENKNNE